MTKAVFVIFPIDRANSNSRMLDWACRSLFVCAWYVALGSCASPTVEQQTIALTATPASLSERQLQSRRFESRDERMILAACAGVLQDLGFTIEESSKQVGLIVGSKDRDAVEAGQVAGQFFLAALVAAIGGVHDPVWEKNQKIRISILTRAVPDSSTLVRVTIQRVIWNTKNRVSRVEPISEPQIYQRFFDKLSQSVFLEAHQI